MDAVKTKNRPSHSRLKQRLESALPRARSTRASKSPEVPSPQSPGERGHVLDTSWRQYRAECSWRPPHWRWAAALALRDEPGLPLRLDDPIQEEAHQFVKALEKASLGAQPSEPLPGRPELQEAYAIFADPQASRRVVLEAWVLTGLPVEEIATKTNFSPAVICVYEQLFFDVRDRLDFKSFISLAVLELHPRPAPDLANVLKIYAVRDGPVMLEYLIGLLADCIHPEAAESKKVRPDPALDLTVTTTIAMLVLPTTPKTQFGIIEYCQHLQRAEITGRKPRDQRKLYRLALKLVRLAVRERSLPRTDVVQWLLSKTASPKAHALES
jgi:hypothetical protein